MQRGAVTNQVDEHGVTCQAVAAFLGDKELSEWLFYRGAWKNRSHIEGKEGEKKEALPDAEADAAEGPKKQLATSEPVAAEGEAPEA